MKNITIEQAFYCIIGVSIFATLYLHFIPKDKISNWYSVSVGYHFKLEEYDWEKTIKRHKKALIFALFYSIIILVLYNIFGEYFAKIGIIILAIIFLIFGFWIGPVKK